MYDKTPYGKLHELLANAQEAGIPVERISLSIHDVPADTALTWLQDELLDKVERGAGNGNNPPTGRLGNIANVYISRT